MGQTKKEASNTYMNRSLTMLVYGESKVGKSTFAITAPYPRLMLDVEGGHRFLPINIKYWDPKVEAPPLADGTWDTCVVVVRDYDTVIEAYKYLNSGRHHFKSVILDSISELQDKCISDVAGTEQMKMQQWGEVLRILGTFLRQLRDLTMHPTNPIQAVVITAMAKIDDTTKRYKPYLQGQLQIQVPYLYDILGAIAIESAPNQDVMKAPIKSRRMYVERTDKYEAGERVQGRLGAIIEQQNLSIETMINMIYPQQTETPTQENGAN